MHTVTSLLDLYQSKGSLAYDGEGVSQLQHAWQCGQLARQAGASDALHLASWLHDVGHLLSDAQGTPTLRGLDDRHEVLGATVLLGVFGSAVAEPVRLHVLAKRYLVTLNPGYRAGLSADSRRSLALQGDAMDATELQAFAAMAHSRDAQQLRTWDDQAKRPGWSAADEQAALDELRALTQRLALD